MVFAVGSGFDIVVVVVVVGVFVVVVEVLVGIEVVAGVEVDFAIGVGVSFAVCGTAVAAVAVAVAVAENDGGGDDDDGGDADTCLARRQARGILALTLPSRYPQLRFLPWVLGPLVFGSQRHRGMGVWLWCWLVFSLWVCVASVSVSVSARLGLGLEVELGLGLLLRHAKEPCKGYLSTGFHPVQSCAGVSVAASSCVRALVAAKKAWAVFLWLLFHPVQSSALVSVVEVSLGFVARALTVCGLAPVPFACCVLVTEMKSTGFFSHGLRPNSLLLLLLRPTTMDATFL